MTTKDLWEAFTQGGVMIHCVRYDGPDPSYGGEFLEAIEGEIVTFPRNIPLLTIPAVLTTNPVPLGSDPIEVAEHNAAVADRVLREVVRRTRLTFQFSGERVHRTFVFDGSNPTVLVEPDESVELDGMPVTVILSSLDC